MKTYAIRSAILAIILNALFVIALAHSLTPVNDCHTDTECAAQCPAGDIECDGSPQS